MIINKEKNMKYGILWFLHLNVILPASKFAVVPFFIVGFIVPIDSFIFPLAWLLFAVCCVVAILTIRVQVPSTGMVTDFIEKNSLDFENKIKGEFKNSSSVEFLTLQSFAQKSTMKLSREVGRKKIYGCLVMLGLVRTNDELWLLRSDLTLYKKGEATTYRYKIENPADVAFDKQNIGEEEVKINVTINNEKFTVFCRDDYHLKYFLAQNFNK